MESRSCPKSLQIVVFNEIPVPVAKIKCVDIIYLDPKFPPVDPTLLLLGGCRDSGGSRTRRVPLALGRVSSFVLCWGDLGSELRNTLLSSFGGVWSLFAVNVTSPCPLTVAVSPFPVRPSVLH